MRRYRGYCRRFEALPALTKALISGWNAQKSPNLHTNHITSTISYHWTNFGVKADECQHSLL